ncbi:MAG TPA: ATP phosphoribosyltransferase [Cryomorphaceae bacterium]|nr:ATP phosphoribosyltransferase [Cryomorphaceae bacterium]HKL39322.1 ATP phosphoribosyltransferase [Cryomorphaceae bacterium]
MKLKVAVQKGGRLSEKSVALLKSCGIKVSNGGKLRSEATNFPLEVLYLRDDDIPQYVADGVADLGIVGENVVKEKKKDIKVAEALGFAKCRLSMAVQRELDYPGIDWFNGKKIATSYPNIVQTFLDEKGLTAEIEEISGSVEIAPSIGLADAVCDIVSTGSTLLANGLKEVETVDRSEAVLIQNKNLSAEKAELVEKLLFRIRAVNKADKFKYILLNAPNDSLAQITSLLPGMKSPTVLPLAKEGWSSLHSVVKEDEFWEVIDKLRSAGAEGILVCPIEKMVL